MSVRGQIVCGQFVILMFQKVLEPSRRPQKAPEHSRQEIQLFKMSKQEIELRGKQLIWHGKIAYLVIFLNLF